MVRLVAVKPRTEWYKFLLTLDLMITIPLLIFLIPLIRNPLPLAAILFILLFSTLILVFKTYRLILHERLIDDFLKMVRINGSSLFFTEPLNFEFGTLVVEEYIVRSGRHTHRKTSVGLNPSSNIKSLSSMNLNHVPQGHLLLLNKSACGVLIAPYARPLRSDLSDILILFLGSSRLFMKPTRLVASSESEYCEARVEFSNGHMSGYIARLRFERSRGARLEFHARAKFTRVYEVDFELARTSDRYFKFSREIDPINELTIIVTSKHGLSLIGLAEQLELRFPMISGFSGGIECKLRLVVDLPFAMDIKSEVPIEISVK